LFYLAWHYHQGVTLAVTPQVASPQGQPLEDATLEQLIKANFQASNDHVGQVARGMGDFADFDWGKLTRVFLHQVQQASRMERFAEVLAITRVWERARQQRKEAQNAQLVWSAAYALERQGDYGKAMEQLTPYAEASDHHRALWASLLLRVGETALATETARQLVHSADAWAQAEAHGLLAKDAYFAEEFTRAINHYEQAKLAWIDAAEPCRAIAAEVGVASCYDCRAEAGDVPRADDIYNDLAEAIVRQGLPLLTALRTRLNQLILWDYHDLKTAHEIRVGFNNLIETLERQDVSKEVLGKTWYNLGQHYYGYYQAYADGVDGAHVDIHHPDLHHARVCYQRALEALEGSRDRVMYACACGELGHVYLLQNNQARAEAFLVSAVDILCDTKQHSLLAEYQQLLAQGDAGEDRVYELGAR
jgi:tetratricopeptide (TPR) repeat protein